jgi:hypothetical protein
MPTIKKKIQCHVSNIHCVVRGIVAPYWSHLHIVKKIRGNIDRQKKRKMWQAGYYYICLDTIQAPCLEFASHDTAVACVERRRYIVLHPFQNKKTINFLKNLFI